MWKIENRSQRIEQMAMHTGRRFKYIAFLECTFQFCCTHNFSNRRHLIPKSFLLLLWHHLLFMCRFFIFFSEFQAFLHTQKILSCVDFCNYWRSHHSDSITIEMWNKNSRVRVREWANISVRSIYWRFNKLTFSNESKGKQGQSEQMHCKMQFEIALSRTKYVHIKWIEKKEKENVDGISCDNHMVEIQK